MVLTQNFRPNNTLFTAYPLPQEIIEDGGMRFLNGSTGIVTLIKQQVKVQIQPQEFYNAWRILYEDVDRENDVNATYLSPGYLNTVQVRLTVLYFHIYECK